MKKLIGFRKTIIVLAGLVACGYLLVPGAYAQDKSPSQINFQFSGLLPGNSTGISGLTPGVTTGNNVTEQATRSGGFQASYSYQFNNWAGVDAGLGSARYTQNYSGDFGESAVQSNLREITTDFVLHIPDHVSRIHPYAVAGVGALRFGPTDNMNNAAGAVSQTRAAFIYGGGADFDISKRIGIRAEYRGARFKVPDFMLSELTMDSETHIGQPSVGIYFKFSGFSRGRKGQTGN